MSTKKICCMINYQKHQDFIELDKHTNLYQYVSQKYQNLDILISCNNKVCSTQESLQQIIYRIKPPQYEFQVHFLQELLDCYLNRLEYFQQQEQQLEQLKLAFKENVQIQTKEIHRLTQELKDKNNQLLLQNNNSQQSQNQNIVTLHLSEQAVGYSFYDTQNNRQQISQNEKNESSSCLDQYSEQSNFISSEIIEKINNCSSCNTLVQQNQIELKCNHAYHEECLKNFIDSQLVDKAKRLICMCGQKINQSALNQLDSFFLSNCQNQMLLNQLTYLLQHAKQDITKCKNINCYFFYINDGSNRSSYCPVCLI